MAISRIDPQQAKHDVETAEALLVCAYDDQAKFEASRLEGAVSLDVLRSREDDLSKQRELIIY